MVEKKSLACDMCGKDPARKVTIIIGNKAWRTDLCEEHAGLMNPILAHAHESQLPPARTRGPYEKVSLQTLMEASSGGER